MRSITVISRNERLHEIRVGLVSPINGAKVEQQSWLLYFGYTVIQRLPVRQTANLFLTAQKYNSVSVTIRGTT